MAASRGCVGSGGDSDLDSEDTDEWIGEVDVEDVGVEEYGISKEEEERIRARMQAEEASIRARMQAEEASIRARMQAEEASIRARMQAEEEEMEDEQESPEGEAEEMEDEQESPEGEAEEMEDEQESPQRIQETEEGRRGQGDGRAQCDVVAGEGGYSDAALARDLEIARVVVGEQVLACTHTHTHTNINCSLSGIESCAVSDLL
jgi:hypothetical protein